MSHKNVRWARIREKIFKRDKYTCRSCGTKENLTVHHIIPRAEGGKDVMKNLETLCIKCHDEIEIGNDPIIVIDDRPESTDWHAWVYGGARRPE